MPAGQLPKSLLELAEPAWKGKVAIAPTDSDFVPLVGAIAATYGKQAAVSWLAGLKHNAQLYQSDESVVAAVNRGDVATGIINHYYWYRLRLEVGAQRMHSALYFFPDHNVGSLAEHLRRGRAEDEQAPSAGAGVRAVLAQRNRPADPRPRL